MRWRKLTKCGRCGKKGAYLNWGGEYSTVQCRYCKCWRVFYGSDATLEEASVLLAGTWEDGVRGPDVYVYEEK